MINATPTLRALIERAHDADAEMVVTPDEYRVLVNAADNELAPNDSHVVRKWFADGCKPFHPSMLEHVTDEVFREHGWEPRPMPVSLIVRLPLIRGNLSTGEVDEVEIDVKPVRPEDYAPSSEYGPTLVERIERGEVPGYGGGMT